MKKLLMSAITGFMGAGVVHAATLSCGQLQKIYKADKMNVVPYNCGDDNPECKDRQLEQIRKTALFYKHTDAKKMSREELEARFEPQIYRILADETVFEVINIDLGDNSFELVFEGGGTRSSGISIEDGTINVDGNDCKNLAFEPYMSQARKGSICKKVVAQVKEKIPTSTFTEELCLSNKRREKTEMYVESFTRKIINVHVSRNLEDVGGWYVSCSGTLNRETDYAYKMNCEVQDHQQ